MKLPPAVIVHSLGMAQAALDIAAGRPVTLLSGEGAGAYAGVAWWHALVAAATAGAPDANLHHVLDCGGAAGRALEALRAGQKLLVLRASAAVWEDLAGRAAGLAATLLADAPPALDMADTRARRRLDAWLCLG